MSGMKEFTNQTSKRASMSQALRFDR